MKFKEIITELKKFGYIPNEMHSIPNEEPSHYLMVDINDWEYSNIEMLFIKEWIRKNKQLDISIETVMDEDDGYTYAIYISRISIIQKNGKCKWQLDYEKDGYNRFSYFECLQYAISVAIEHFNE